jgi:hypothetical protein
MPELLRAYGEILSEARDDLVAGVLVVLLCAVLAMSVVFVLGAIAESVARSWKRDRDAHKSTRHHGIA